MASQIFSFTVTTPVGQAKAAPLVTPMTMPPRTVRRIEIRVPPGPNGELGFQVGMVAIPVVPANPTEFIVTSDEILSWDLDTGITSGAWQFISYNTGNYPHTVQVRFYCDLIVGQDSGPGITLVSGAAIASA